MFFPFLPLDRSQCRSYDNRVVEIRDGMIRRPGDPRRRAVTVFRRSGFFLYLFFFWWLMIGAKKNTKSISAQSKWLGLELQTVRNVLRARVQSVRAAEERPCSPDRWFITRWRGGRNRTLNVSQECTVYLFSPLRTRSRIPPEGLNNKSGRGRD